jgi:hypothetical protein
MGSKLAEQLQTVGRGRREKREEEEEKEERRNMMW